MAFQYFQQLLVELENVRKPDTSNFIAAAIADGVEVPMTTNQLYILATLPEHQRTDRVGIRELTCPVDATYRGRPVIAGTMAMKLRHLGSDANLSAAVLGYADNVEQRSFEDAQIDSASGYGFVFLYTDGVIGSVYRGPAFPFPSVTFWHPPGYEGMGNFPHPATPDEVVMRLKNTVPINDASGKETAKIVGELVHLAVRAYSRSTSQEPNWKAMAAALQDQRRTPGRKAGIVKSQKGNFYATYSSASEKYPDALVLEAGQTRIPINLKDELKISTPDMQEFVADEKFAHMPRERQYARNVGGKLLPLTRQQEDAIRRELTFRQHRN